MKNKIFLGLICCLLVVGLATGCGNNKTSSTNNDGNNNNEGNNSNTSKNEKFSNNLTFMGYNIAYPNDANKNPSDYGYLIGTNDYTIIIEAPATAGIIFEASDINDAPKLCEDYLIKTLEHKIRSLFNFDKTEQTIKSSSVVNKNGIKMLRNSGVFKNIDKNSEIEFVSYYLLAGANNNVPMYIVGVPMKDSNTSIEKLVDEISSHITK